MRAVFSANDPPSPAGPLNRSASLTCARLCSACGAFAHLRVQFVDVDRLSQHTMDELQIARALDVAFAPRGDDDRAEQKVWRVPLREIDHFETVALRQVEIEKNDPPFRVTVEMLLRFLAVARGEGCVSEALANRAKKRLRRLIVLDDEHVGWSLVHGRESILRRMQNDCKSFCIERGYDDHA